MTGTMHALVLDGPGAPFRLESMPIPQPGPGEVLVRIHASGVNPLDLKIAAGEARHARHPLPAILGLDMAGTVEATGSGVTRFAVGDAVYGMTGGVGGIQGSLAEYAAVDADLLALKPALLSMREAAALPLVAITAWEGLVDRAGVRMGEAVLVHGGAGGVGSIAIQIARALGAEVHATGRAGHAAAIREAGAVPIDFESETVADYVAAHTAGRGFDLVYDTLGGATLDASFEAVRRAGRVVSCLGWGTHSLAPLSFKNASYAGVFTLLPLLTGEGRQHHGEILASVARLAAEGQIRPRIDARAFDLGAAAEAYESLGSRRNDGRVVIDLV